MQVVKYLDKVPVQLGNRIGDGSDGEVFEIENTNKVIKFSIYGNETISNVNKEVEKQLLILDFIMKNPSKSFVCVYEYGDLGKRFIKNEFGTIHYRMYYYIMDKLNFVSKLEYNVLRNIIYPKDEKGYIDFDTEYFSNLTEEQLSYNLEKIKCSKNLSRRIKSFHKDVINYPIYHWDVNTYNIMKDVQNNFRLVDFDRCDFKKE